MKIHAFLTPVLALCVGLPIEPIALGQLSPGELTAYPWVEASDTVRVPKAFLSHLEFDALEYAAGGEVPWQHLSAKFIQLYRLTEAESRAVNDALRKATREIRFAEGRHMKPLTEEASLDRYRSPDGLTVLEQRQFVLEPYSEARRTIEAQRDQEITGILGKDRAGRLSEHSTFKLPTGVTVIENPMTVTFRRIEIGGRQSVDRVRVHAGGGGFEGGPFFEVEDEFAPESLRPVLKRWRAAIAEYDRTNRAASLPSRDSGSPSPNPAAVETSQPAVAVAPSAGWDDTATFADIPKSLISQLGVAGICDDVLCPEAVVLFGLRPDEAAAVNSLFSEMKAKFEQLEATQLARPNPLSGRFILHRFPALAGELRSEWTRRLEALVGKSRAKLLNACIGDTSAESHRGLRALDTGKPRFSFVEHGTVWLNRGEKDVQFEVSMGQGRDARFSLEYQVLEGEGSNHGSMGGPLRSFPPELSHLFRSEMFAPRGSPKAVEP